MLVNNSFPFFFDNQHFASTFHVSGFGYKRITMYFLVQSGFWFNEVAISESTNRYVHGLIVVIFD